MQSWRQTFEPMLRAARARLRGHWHKALQVRERLVLSEETLHLVLAGLVGVVGGLVNWVFYHAVRWLQWAIAGYPGHSIVEAARSMELLPRILTPTLGGLAAGLVLYWGLRLVGPQRTTNLLEVVVAGDGRLPLRSGLVRFFSSLLSMASGASIGREGAIVQLCATVASRCGQWAKWQPYRLRLLVACGAAAGIAAAYNAPIAGAVFAAQIVLGNFSMNLFAPLLFSSVIASMMSRSFFGLEPWYQAPGFNFTSLSQLPWFVVLGLLSGVLGAYFLRLLRSSQEMFKQVPTLYMRLACGGLLVGVIALAFPDVWGNGYDVINEILHHDAGLKMLAGIFAAKLLATLCSVGSGAVGGVFTPTLFLGAALGSLMGTALQRYGFSPAHLPVSAYALVGMGSVLSATTRSPLLAIIVVIETSLNYSLMPALMLGCAVSTLVARRLSPHSIYTEPLRLRGLEIESSRLGAATENTVGDLMRKPVPPIRESTALPEIAERFLGSTNNFIPVVDALNKLIGVVALQDVKAHLSSAGELSVVIASELMRPPPDCLTPGQKLLDALPIVLASELRNVPVVNTLEEMRLVGSAPRAEVLAALSEAIAPAASAAGADGAG